MNEILTYEYNGKAVEFFLGSEVMINATEMGAIFGKRPVDFLTNESAKKMIEAMKKRPFPAFRSDESSLLNAGNAVLTPEKEVRSDNGTLIYATYRAGHDLGATWMHRWLAIDFAMWMDVDFKLWVIERIDYLFVSSAQAQRKLIVKENLLLKQRRQILDEHGNDPVVLKLAQVDDDLKDIRNQKSNETRKNYKMWSVD